MTRPIRAMLAAILALVLGTALAQDPADELADTVEQTVDTARQTQQMQDAWAEEQAALTGRFRAVQARVDYLQDRLAVERDRARALDDRVAELERRLRESDRLQAVIEDSLAAVFQELADVVAGDLPFLPAERARRVTSLREELARPEVAAAEKLRRLLEAILVEAQYGSTVEVTQEAIALDGEEIYVDMLRLGRLQLFWLTPDQARAGTWDPVAEQWVELPGRYRRTLARTIEMATRRRPVELVTLPIGRIAP